MTDAALFRVTSRRVGAETLAHDLENWHIDHAEAMAVREVEGIIDDVLSLGKDTLRITKSLYADLRASRLRSPFLLGEGLTALYGVLLQLCERLHHLATTGFLTGYHVEGLSELQSLRGSLHEANEWLLKAWPRVDVALQQQALDDYQAGRVLTPEEAIRELLARSTPSDR